MNDIFVFGSNLGGRHCAGAALYAKQNYGAIDGQGAGLQGQSYAIPTKDARMRTLPLSEIQSHVARFLSYAGMCYLKNSKLQFHVTPIGCGHFDHTPKDVAPMFKIALELPNITLPREFAAILYKSVYKFNPKVCTKCGEDFIPNSGAQQACCKGL